jgi:hypothetical protein
MEANSSFLTKALVKQLVTTNVVDNYLVSVREPRLGGDVSKLDEFQGQVSERCFLSAGTVEGVVNQLGDRADRIVRSRSDSISFIFIGEAKYAMLECDEDGAIVALLSDRTSSSEAETWVVEPGGLTTAVQRIRTFLGAPHGANP